MDVSRETTLKFNIYKSLLVKWQKTINLVSCETLNQIEERHIRDSLQLIGYIPPGSVTLVDLGSGAGFPGLIIAMATSLKVTLVEADQRKSIFLQTVSRETNTAVEILPMRIEDIKQRKFDVITSRALAALPQLLEYAFPLTNEQSSLLFLKGKSFNKEIEASQKKWHYHLEEFDSQTESGSKVLKLTHLKQKDSTWQK